MSCYKLKAKSGKARRGEVKTAHGTFQTPAFMPVGTQATVKGVSPRDLRELGAEIVLSNTYHLHLRPGEQLIKAQGGLHKFMGWDGPILTDSGGFQVFSLANLRSIDDESVKFKSHIDGRDIELTPERVIQIQSDLGVDIMMVLDECAPYKASEAEIRQALERSLKWAARSIPARRNEGELVFSIVQGGFSEELRKEAIERSCSMEFDGYALGGLSVGEPPELMHQLFASCLPQLPEDKPRYVMGVGYPKDIALAVQAGADMFDCVMPTRSARFGRIFHWRGHLNIKNARFREDSAPLEEGCQCYTCKNFSRSYLSHLFHAGEALAVQLLSIHNLAFYQSLMAKIRSAIGTDSFEALVKELE